jgi:RHS repeat-associated protein
LRQGWETTNLNGLQSYTDDQAGNVTNDSANAYLYDAEGRVCAVQSGGNGGPATGYVYDADGNRVAKGSLTQFTCDMNPADTYNPATNTGYNGFQATASYILGPGNEQLTEVDGQGNWQHTNVFAGGALIATYALTSPDVAALYFQLSDWLGTRRVETDYAGNPCLNFTGLPFGDGLATAPIPCLSSDIDATEHHFTGKERDAESGNDYFVARYYGSSMGRFMSPDPSGIASADPASPQSWNLYNYVLNNPLVHIDPNGLDCATPAMMDSNCGGGISLGDASTWTDSPQPQAEDTTEGQILSSDSQQMTQMQTQQNSDDQILSSDDKNDPKPLFTFWVDVLGKPLPSAPPPPPGCDMSTPFCNMWLQWFLQKLQPKAPSTATQIKIALIVAKVVFKAITPSCAQVKNQLATVGHVGSVASIAGWGYTAWTGVTVPYLAGATAASAGADLVAWGMDAIPGCK